MALQITITDAGRAEIINAQNTGTAAVTIAQIGFGKGRYVPKKSQTTLAEPIKRVSSVAGLAVSDTTIHVTAKDEGQDAYDVGEFGLFSDKGTLIAVYSQVADQGWIIQKARVSTLLLAIDIQLDSISAASLVFGDVVFINPPASTTVRGVVELADDDETQEGTDAERVVTPRSLKSLSARTDRAGLVALANTLDSDSESKALTGAQGKKLQQEKIGKDRIQKSRLDTTSGALLTAGSFGLGIVEEAPEFPLLNGSVLNQHVASGTYAKSDSKGTGGPTGNEGHQFIVVAERWNAENVVLRFIGVGANEGREWTNTYTGYYGRWTGWIENWHAANLVKQTGALDSAAGALLAVGAFGLGAESAPVVEDCNDIARNGIYGIANWSLNAPVPGMYGSLIQIGRALSEQSQLVFRHDGGGQMYVRTRYSVTAKTWGTWRRVYDTSQISGFMQGLLEDQTASDARQRLGVVRQTEPGDRTPGRVMINGAFGLGSDAISISKPDEPYRATGFYEVPSSTDWPSRPAIGWTRLLHISHSNVAGYATQYATGGFESNGHRYFQRTCAGGNWSNWVELFHTGNFDPAQKVSRGGDGMYGKLTIAFDAGGSPRYDNGHLELRGTDNGNPVTLGFHRPGLSACSLAHHGTGLVLYSTDGVTLAAFEGLLNGSQINRGIIDPSVVHASLRNCSTSAADQDPNWTLDPTMLTSHPNSPGLGVYWHITTTFYAGISTGANRAQLAIQYNGGAAVFARSCYSGVWTPWRRCDNVAVNANTANLASPGWWRCADTGFIRQWGEVGTIGVDASVQVTLPITFPNAMFGANANGTRAPSGSTGAIIYTRAFSQSSFIISNDNDPTPVVWEAWGC